MKKQLKILLIVTQLILNKLKSYLTRITLSIRMITLLKILLIISGVIYLEIMEIPKCLDNYIQDNQINTTMNLYNY